MKNKRRFATATAGVLGLAVGSLVMVAGPASADPHANQQWVAEDGQTYLGLYAGGGSYFGHIKTLQNTDKCMAANTGNPAYYSGLEGSPVVLWDCWYSQGSMWDDHTQSMYDGQHWQQIDNGDGSWTYQLTVHWGNVPTSQPPNSVSYYCLDSLNGHNYDGSPVQMWGCNAQNFQQWTIGPSGQLQSVAAPGKCLDDTNWGTTDGSPMQLWDCFY